MKWNKMGLTGLLVVIGIRVFAGVPSIDFMDSVNADSCKGSYHEYKVTFPNEKWLIQDILLNPKSGLAPESIVRGQIVRNEEVGEFCIHSSLGRGQTLQEFNELGIVEGQIAVKFPSGKWMRFSTITKKNKTKALVAECMSESVSGVVMSMKCFPGYLSQELLPSEKEFLKRIFSFFLFEKDEKGNVVPFPLIAWFPILFEPAFSVDQRDYRLLECQNIGIFTQTKWEGIKPFVIETVDHPNVPAWAKKMLGSRWKIRYYAGNVSLRSNRFDTPCQGE